MKSIKIWQIVFEALCPIVANHIWGCGSTEGKTKSTQKPLALRWVKVDVGMVVQANDGHSIAQPQITHNNGGKVHTKKK
jgi:hypothetical protein